MESLETIKTDLSAATIGAQKSLEGLDAHRFLRLADLFLVAVLVTVPPLFFLPLFTDWFESTKTAFITLVAGLAALVFFLRLLINARTRLTHTSVDLTLVLILASLSVSSWLTNNRVNSFLAEPVGFFGLTLLFFVLVNTLTTWRHWSLAVRLFLWSLAIPAILAAGQVILSLAQNFFPPIQIILNYNPLLVNFSPVGTFYNLALLLSLGLPLNIARIATGKHRPTFKLEPIILLTINIVGLTALAWILYQHHPIILDSDTGRRIVGATLGKSYQNALFGVGPGQFISAFNQYRGGEFNNFSYWSMAFLTSSSFLFYVLTIGGVALAAAFIALFYRIYTVGRKRWSLEADFTLEKGLLTSTALFFLLTVFLPMPFVTFWFLFTAIGFLFSWYHLQGASFTGELTASRKIHLALPVLAISLTGLSLFWQIKSLRADYYYRQSLQAAAARKALETYNHQAKALAIYPGRDYYHVSFSQTNLAIADALAGQNNLTDEQKQTVLKLVQQAINSGRNAAIVAPNIASNWLNLASIYRNLINFAQGADQWSVSSLNEAIRLSPHDPKLFFEMGSTFLTTNDLPSAGNYFAAATKLKPDFANAHYNLAQVLKRLNLTDRAVTELQITSQLLCLRDSSSESDDCQRVKKELAQLANSPGKDTSVTEQEKVAGTATGSAALDQSLPLPPNQEVPNLPKAKSTPPAKVSTTSGTITSEPPTSP